MTLPKVLVAFAATGILGLVLVTGSVSQTNGDEPKLTTHIDQSAIATGRYRLNDLIEFGRFLFSTNFNRLDGFGRPAATGNGTPTKRVPGSAPFMTRVSAPDANSCAGCHNTPEVGGAGDNVANVFVLAHVRDPITESVSAEFSNERNTLGMHGSGVIEMLAREMSGDMIAIREAAKAQAAQTGQDVRRSLDTKGVHFGFITAHPDGTVDTSEVEGVDADLIVKPFHQKGVVVSVREFTVNAYNHHHGLQAVERFGVSRTGEEDFDEDGIRNEMTEGDITAATIFQASLGVPQLVWPRNGAERTSVSRGMQLFNQIGCADCHKPALRLENPVFSEPNPFNPPGNLRPGDVTRPFTFDMRTQLNGPGLERDGRGAIVRAFTDLKRHVICDDDDPFFANEQIVQGGVRTDAFITRKLWDCGNTGPWGHKGNCSTIGEAIVHHSGEAKESRQRYQALAEQQRRDIVRFLEALRIVPSLR